MSIKVKRRLTFFAYLVAYVVLLAILVVGARNFNEAKKNTEKIDENTTAIKQNGEAIYKTARENNEYIKCLAEVFANYTQDQTPITIENLNKCTVSSKEAAAQSNYSIEDNPSSINNEPKNQANQSTQPKREPQQSKKRGLRGCILDQLPLGNPPCIIN